MRNRERSHNFSPYGTSAATFARGLWMKKMSARQRKTLVVCRQCHEKIQYGRYDGETLRRKNYRKAK
jgi:hypothetical protein